MFIFNNPSIFIFLLLNFLSPNQLLVLSQTLINPIFDQSFLPLGSQINGRLISRCNNKPTPTATAAVFSVRNNCPFTVWAAAVPGGGQLLTTGQFWTLNLPATTSGRVWGRTNCTFDQSGNGKCETGDCNGLLQCQRFGSPPNTIAEFTLNSNSMNTDFFDISVVDGFNIPIQFRPVSNGCNNSINCVGDINGECPAKLRVAGGCNNPCTVFKSDEHCCGRGPANCGPTNYSKFFKDRCPNVYTYPFDDKNTTFSCPTSTNYNVVFCP